MSDLDELERLARAQASGYARMLELNGGIGKLGIEHPEMYDDMLAWNEATVNEHADTVLALVARVREAEAERDEGWRVAAEQTRLERARAERAEAALSGLMEQRVTRWACVVVESGYHNGARCTPDEPHADWGCGYRVALDNHGALHILSTYEKGATQ